MAFRRKDEPKNTGKKIAMETTFLKEEEIWGDDALEVMKAYGTKVAPTDLAVLLGAQVTGDEDQRTSEGELTCLAWSASTGLNNYARVVHYYGDKSTYKPTGRWVTTRPALPSSETSRLHPQNVRIVKLSNGESVKIAEWGEYPQAVTSLSMHKTLDKELSRSHLRETGKKYTFDSEDLTAYSDKFNPRECPEFEFEGKRYIRLIAKKANDYSVLSTGEKVEEGKMYWVEVQPVEWLMDPSGIWVIKKAPYAGVQFDIKEKYDGNFNNTFMKKFLDTYFSKDIQYGEKTHKDLKQQIENLAPEELANLPQKDPELLQKIVVFGQLASVFEGLPYAQQMPLYKSTREQMTPDEKKAIENIIRASRQNQSK